MVCGCSQKTVARGCNSEGGAMKRDLYAEVSTRIVAELERGAAPWIKPWSATAGMNTPCNAATNRPYSGSNVVLLWMAQTAGYRTPRFLTFKQALELGGNVRKGEHGTKVYFVKQLQVADRNGEEGKTRIVPMMREYTVFNVDQCEGLPDRVLTLGEVKVRNADLRSAPDFQDLRGLFDTVVCLNVVEHVEDDLAALRNIFSALQPGGVAIILVPQDQAAYGTLDEVLGHYRRYSEAQLRARMEEAGFHIECMLHFNRVTRPGWRINGQLLRRRSFSRFQLRLFDALVPSWPIRRAC